MGEGQIDSDNKIIRQIFLRGVERQPYIYTHCARGRAHGYRAAQGRGPGKREAGGWPQWTNRMGERPTASPALDALLDALLDLCQTTIHLASLTISAHDSSVRQRQLHTRSCLTNPQHTGAYYLSCGAELQMREHIVFECQEHRA